MRDNRQGRPERERATRLRQVGEWNLEAHLANIAKLHFDRQIQRVERARLEAQVGQRRLALADRNVDIGLVKDDIVLQVLAQQVRHETLKHGESRGARAVRSKQSRLAACQWSCVTFNGVLPIADGRGHALRARCPRRLGRKTCRGVPHFDLTGRGRFRLAGRWFISHPVLHHH